MAGLLGTRCMKVGESRLRPRLPGPGLTSAGHAGHGMHIAAWPAAEVQVIPSPQGVTPKPQRAGEVQVLEARCSESKKALEEVEVCFG